MLSIITICISMYMYILTCKNRLEKKSEKLSTNAKEYMNATRGKKATTTKKP